MKRKKQLEIISMLIVHGKCSPIYNEAACLTNVRIVDKITKQKNK